MGLLTLDRAKKLVDLCTLDVFENLHHEIIYETPELKEKIENYIKSKKELENLLEIKKIEKNKDEEIEL